MNPESCCQKSRITAYVIGIGGTFLLMAALVCLMRSYTQSPSLAEVRGQERLKILAEFREANDPIVTKYDWQDQGKGIVRVPVERAKELILDEWQNPAVGHSNLMARAAKAFAPAPKVVPPKNPYE